MIKLRSTTDPPDCWSPDSRRRSGSPIKYFRAGQPTFSFLNAIYIFLYYNKPPSFWGDEQLLARPLLPIDLFRSSTLALLIKFFTMAPQRCTFPFFFKQMLDGWLSSSALHIALTHSVWLLISNRCSAMAEQRSLQRTAIAVSCFSVHLGLFFAFHHPKFLDSHSFAVAADDKRVPDRVICAVKTRLPFIATTADKRARGRE